MEVQEKICQLCLEKCDEFYSIEQSIKHVLTILLPKIDFTIVQEPVICKNCTEIVIKCFDFKAICLNMHDYIVPFINKNATKLDLKYVYKSKNVTDADVPEDHNICGFCMSLVKNCSTLSLDVGGDVMLEEMIKRCLPELDFSGINNPVICALCYGSLKNSFHFLTNCLIANEKMQYCETINLKCKSELGQSSLLHVREEIPHSKIADDAENKNENCMDQDVKEVTKFTSKNVFGCEVNNNFDMSTIEELFFRGNNTTIKKENLIEMDYEACLLNEEIEIKTDDNDFKRFDDGFILPQQKPTTLHRRQKNLLLDRKHASTNEKSLQKEMWQSGSRTFETKFKSGLTSHLLVHKNASKATMYKCDSCPYETKHKNKLASHLLVHKNASKATMYKCNFCWYETKHKNKLASHLLVHKNASKATMYKCNSCPYETKHKNKLASHLLVHNDPSEVTLMYKCEICPYQTKYKSNLTSHLTVSKKQSEIRIYKCNFCSYQTKRKKCFNIHSLLHKDSSQLTAYKCDSCSYQTEHKGRLASHVLVHKYPPEVTTYICDFCSYQATRTEYLQVHLLLHKDPSQITVYKCDFCSFQTKLKCILKTHLSKHRNPDVTLFKCEFCPFQTKYKKSLSSHLLVHKDPSEVIFYKCNFCSYQTKRKRYLRVHSQLHDIKRTAMLKCDSCSFQTRRKNTLITHFLRHKNPSEITMYKCDFCPYETKLKRSLKLHLLKHTVHK